MSTETPSFEKQPAEEYFVGFEFSGRLPSGANLDSGTVAAIDVDTGSDVAATVLDSTTATVSGTQATVGCKAGNNGQTIKITFSMTLDNASADILEEDLIMKVIAI